MMIWEHHPLRSGLLCKCGTLALSEHVHPGGPQVTTDVCVFVFDLLYHDGETLLKVPLRERRARLAAALPGMSPGRVQLATAVEIDPAGEEVRAGAAGTAEQQPQQQPQLEAVADVQAAPGEAVTMQQAAAGGADSAAPEQQQASDALKDVQQAAAVVGPTGSGDEEQAVVQQAGRPAAASMEQRVFELLLQSFDAGTEGLMLKRLDNHAGMGRCAGVQCCMLVHMVLWHALQERWQVQRQSAHAAMYQQMRLVVWICAMVMTMMAMSLPDARCCPHCCCQATSPASAANRGSRSSVTTARASGTHWTWCPSGRGLARAARWGKCLALSLGGGTAAGCAHAQPAAAPDPAAHARSVSLRQGLLIRLLTAS